MSLSQTVDLNYERKAHPFNSDVQMAYLVMTENQIQTETDAIIHYNFTNVRQYVVYNEKLYNQRNGQPRGGSNGF